MPTTQEQSRPKREQVLVRLPLETYTALQLAQPFVRSRSMQDLLASIIDDFLEDLRTNDQGFRQALVGLRESQALRAGVLSRRKPPRADEA